VSYLTSQEFKVTDMISKLASFNIQFIASSSFII